MTETHKNDHNEDVRLVPFTNEELENLQLTLLGKMMQLTHDLHEGKIPSETVDEEMQKLGQVSEKVSRYCKTYGVSKNKKQPLLKT